MTRFIALAAVSAAILAYEVLLTRLFAIIQWHHFAFLAISIALLGFGVSAAVLALLQRRVAPHIDAVFSICALGFSALGPVAFLAAQSIPFNALELVWDPARALDLGAIYLTLAVPFTLGAACICLAFLRPEDRAGRVYFWNLTGSAAGALGVVFTLSLLSPANNLAAVSGLGLVAAVLGFLAQGGLRGRSAAVLVLLAGAAVWQLAPASWLSLRIAEQKGLAVALTIDGAELIEERFGPLGLVSVVENPVVPFRSAPGLSLAAPAPPPEQVALFIDADAMTMIDADAGRRPAAYLRYTTDALVYSLVTGPKVLVLGSGGGRQVAQALAHGARHIDAIETNPDVVDLVADTYGAFAGGLYDREEVSVRVGDLRGFVAANDGAWDVIVFGTSGSGAFGLSETYLLTVEAMELLLRHLDANGWLSFTWPLELPPRAIPKLMLTALMALERLDVPDPGGHLILIRGLATTTLLVGRDPVGAADIAHTIAFAEARAFDLAFYSGMARSEANRFNRLAEPVFFDAATALTGQGRGDFVARYKFDIEPAWDDRPYFHDFFRWRTLPELVAMRRTGAAALIELGELILIAALVQALVISLVLILVPLKLGGLARGRGLVAWSAGAFFTAIGLAFFFVEIAFIQKFILFLSHPTYAVAVVVAGFLVFAGCGARASEALARLLSARFGLTRAVAAVDVAVIGVVLVAVAYLVVAPAVFAACAGLPTAGRAVVSLLLIAPLAFFMGMPFPLGLTLVRRADPSLVPWAWGVNGCASVTSAILAVLLAMHVGYVAVVLLALALYATATWAIRGIAPGDTYAP